MEVAILVDEAGAFDRQHLAKSLVERIGGKRRVQPRQGRLKPADEENFAERRTFLIRPFGLNIRAVDNLVSQLAKPVERSFLNVRFDEVAHDWDDSLVAAGSS